MAENEKTDELGVVFKSNEQILLEEEIENIDKVIMLSKKNIDNGEILRKVYEDALRKCKSDLTNSKKKS